MQGILGTLPLQFAQSNVTAPQQILKEQGVSISIGANA